MELINNDRSSKTPSHIAKLVDDFMSLHPEVADLKDDLFILCSNVANLIASSNDNAIISSKLSTLESKIDLLSSSLPTKPNRTYAQVIGAISSPSETKSSSSPLPHETKVLLVYPNKGSSQPNSNLTPAAFKEALDLKSNRFGISRLHSIKKGGVLIEARNSKEIASLESLISARFSDSVTFATPQLRNPEIRIKNIDKDYEESDIIPLLCSQNLIDDNLKENIRSCKLFTTKFGRCDAVLQVSNPLFESLLKRGKVYLGCSRLDIVQNIHVKSCLNCHGVGHLKNSCPLAGKTVCRKCGAGHPASECKSPTQNCWRCACYSTIKSPPHIFGSENCIIYQNEKKKILEITNYNDSKL